jgi:DNA repair protein RecN (Recombination protein N)
LNVLTGETGAGKSMLVDALSLLVGERASGDLIRPGAERAVVEAAFDVSGMPLIEGLASRAGVDIEEDRLVVRRDINAEGRNRAWANGSPSTVSTLATLGRSLVDLHGQHESQSLLRVASQREILDAFGDAKTELEATRLAFQRASALRVEEQDLIDRRDDVARGRIRRTRGREPSPGQRRGHYQ